MNQQKVDVRHAQFLFDQQYSKSIVFLTKNSSLILVNLWISVRDTNQRKVVLCHAQLFFWPKMFEKLSFFTKEALTIFVNLWISRRDTNRRMNDLCHAHFFGKKYSKNAVFATKKVIHNICEFVDVRALYESRKG